MTISVLQERQTSAGSGNAASIQLAFSNPVTVGSSIHVFCSGVDTATSFTCSDSVNGSYGAALDTIDQAGDTQRLAHFKFDNTAAGTPTVTITPNVSVGFLAIWIREIGGTSGYDSAHKTALQTALGNGTDNITTGTQAPNNQPGLLSALGACTSNFALPTTGTGFTAGANGWDFTVSNTTCTESKRYTALTAIAATFSNASGTQNFATLAAFFKESASAATGVGKSPVRGPGVSPDARQMFRARQLSTNVSQNITVALTGQSATFSTGTLGPSTSVSLTGQAAAGATGILTPVGQVVGAVLFSGPGISPDYQRLFTPRVLSTVVPTASGDVTVALVGQRSAFAQGSFGIGISIPLTGQSSTATVGTLAPGTSVGLTGSSSTSSTGLLTPSLAVQLLGTVLGGTTGIISPGVTVSMNGNLGTFSQGSLSPATSVSLVGIFNSSNTGQLTSSGGDLQITQTASMLLIRRGFRKKR